MHPKYTLSNTYGRFSWIFQSSITNNHDLLENLSFEIEKFLDFPKIKTTIKPFGLFQNRFLSKIVKPKNKQF